MLRIVDKDGKLRAILEDDKDEPTLIEKVTDEKSETGEEDGSDSEDQ